VSLFVKERERELSAAEYLEQALEDLKEARDQAEAELRAKIDSAIKRSRDALEELRSGAEDVRSLAEERTDQWRHMLDGATDEARRDIGIRAVRAQRSPEALKAMANEIKEQREELRLNG
jgi:hypothetical protein